MPQARLDLKGKGGVVGHGEGHGQRGRRRLEGDHRLSLHAGRHEEGVGEAAEGDPVAQEPKLELPTAAVQSLETQRTCSRARRGRRDRQRRPGRRGERAFDVKLPSTLPAMVQDKAIEPSPTTGASRRSLVALSDGPRLSSRKPEATSRPPAFMPSAVMSHAPGTRSSCTGAKSVEFA